MSYIIVGILCLAAGAITAFFVMKNNPKYFDIAAMGKEKLAELKKKIEEIL
jgi:hypothetical protein